MDCIGKAISDKFITFIRLSQLNEKSRYQSKNHHFKRLLQSCLYLYLIPQRYSETWQFHASLDVILFTCPLVRKDPSQHTSCTNLLLFLFFHKPSLNYYGLCVILFLLSNDSISLPLRCTWNELLLMPV